MPSLPQIIQSLQPCLSQMQSQKKEKGQEIDTIQSFLLVNNLRRALGSSSCRATGRTPRPVPRPVLLQQQFLLLPVLWHPRQPVKEHRSAHVEQDKRPHDPEVPPPVRVVRAQLRQVRIGVGRGAEAAVGRRRRVLDVAASVANVFGQVLPAGLARGRVEVRELDARADDARVGQAGREHAVHEVGKGRDAVHEDPEAGQGGGAGEDAAEDQGQREQQLRNVAGCLSCLDASDDHVGKGGSKHQEGPDQEEHKCAALVHLSVGDGVFVHADRVIPAKEDDDGHQRVPGQLDDDVGRDEDFPRVRLGRALADFVQGALHDEVRHGLLHDVAEDGHEHEDGEELVLQALKTGGRLPEGETDEECLGRC